MTIEVVETNTQVVVGSAEAITTTTAEGEMPTVRLTDLLGQEAIVQLAAQARQQAAEGGLKLLGDDGLPQSLTKQIIEAALEAELDEHLAHAGRGPQGAAGGPRRNERNGRRRKSVATE